MAKAAMAQNQQLGYQNGYSQGLHYGQSDRSTGHSYRPTYSSTYQNGSNGSDLSFSGQGVGDLGIHVGRALRARLDAGRLPFPLLPAGECIRATALGASEYSVQLSGNTVYLSSPGQLLPRRNLQVVHPRIAFGDTVDPHAVGAVIRSHLERFDVVEGDTEVALAIGATMVGWRICQAKAT